ncbi:MAG: NAD-dependent epimerase/dehydratase family protein [Bdellovibrionales bacterium]
MKCLVTGATGFVGSWVTRRLVDLGHEVRVLRRESSDLSEIQNLDVQHFIGDITDIESLEKAAAGIDHIFHLAGYVGYSKQARKTMERVNVDGTANVVEVCKKLNLGRLLHFSSVVAVGAGFSKNEILNEDSKYNISALNLGYFETKRAAEEIVVAAARSGEIEAVIVNPSTIYGPGDAKKGSRKIQLKVARGSFPFYTGGGVNVIGIDDVVTGTLSAFEQGRNAERYILAGENITIKELFATIASEAHVPPPKYYLPNILLKTIGKIGDLMESFDIYSVPNSENAATSTMFHWFDNSKAKRELNLNPKSARSAIADSVEWSRKNGLI